MPVTVAEHYVEKAAADVEAAVRALAKLQHCSEQQAVNIVAEDLDCSFHGRTFAEILGWYIEQIERLE